ncbi:MAG: sulfur carrier protein ThiS [Hyphomicrobiales bacterium]|nr:sulfur carrier protein ThiS [Hyphomicrobiales bacterium]
MRLRVNGSEMNVDATTLAALLLELSHEEGAVATARNGAFVRRKDRAQTQLREGDEIEILTPRQGG